MITQLSCSNHHRWSLSSAISNDLTLPACPVCGQAAHLAAPTEDSPGMTIGDDSLANPAGPSSCPNQTVQFDDAAQDTHPQTIGFDNASDPLAQTTATGAPVPLHTRQSEGDTTALLARDSGTDRMQGQTIDGTRGSSELSALSAPIQSPSDRTIDGADFVVSAASGHTTEFGEGSLLSADRAAPPDCGQTTEFGAQATPTQRRAGAPLAPQAGGDKRTQVIKNKQPAQATAPSSIEGYEIISTLGKGGMGIVYKARHLKLDRLVALKMVLSGKNTSKADRARFDSEARAVAQLKHPNIVQIYEIGDHQGQPYFSLEFLEGGTLQEKLEKYSMPSREAAALIETLARALHYAHEKGILHRDMKPANVLLTSDGIPKISDFGLALRLDRADSGNRIDQVVGTPMYMPPEQAQGKSDIGRAADIYSLGATLYEMIVGRPPFRGATVMDTLKLVQQAEPVAPRQLQPSVPADLQTICLKSLHKDPKLRYPSAEAFANDLRNFLEGKPIQARPVPKWEVAWKWARRNRAAASLIAVGCLLMLALAIGGPSFAVVENRRAEEQAFLRDLAEKQERFAKEQRQIAEEQREEAQKQERFAKEQRQLAELRGQEARENFQNAQAAVEVLVRLARNRMTNERHLESVGRELLERALEFYDGFIQKKPNDPLMREQVARAQMLAGDLREKLGKYEKADEVYRLAEKNYQALLKDDPAKANQYRRDLATIHISRSTLLQVLKRDKEADQAFANAKELLDQSTISKVRDPIAEWMMGAGCNNRGVYLHQRREVQLAEEAYKQGIDIFTRLARDFAKEPIYRIELAKTKTNLADLWTSFPPGQPEKAEKYFQEAIAEIAPVLKQFQDVPAYVKELGRAHLSRGKLYGTQGRFREADRDFAQARNTFEDMLRTYPGVADYRYLAAAAHLNLGTSKQRQMDWKAAVAAYRLAEHRLDKLADDEPTITAYQHDRAVCTSNLADGQEHLLRSAVESAQDKSSDQEWSLLAQETEKSMYLALDRWQKLAAIDKGGIQTAAELVKSFMAVNQFHKYLASALRKIKPAEAEAQLERRVAVCKAMLAQQPKTTVIKEMTGEALLALALMRVERDNHVAASQSIDEFSKMVTADSPMYPLAAGSLSLCLPIVEKNLDGDQREKTLKSYSHRAMTMLEDASAAGWKDDNFLKQHPILQPLRQRPELRERLERLQK